jgi:hypothetical protein
VIAAVAVAAAAAAEAELVVGIALVRPVEVALAEALVAAVGFA